MSEPIVVNRKLIKMINLLDYEKKNRAWNGTSLAVQWLRLCAPEAGGTGLIPGWGANIPQDRAKHRREEKKKKKKKTNSEGGVSWLFMLMSFLPR